MRVVAFITAFLAALASAAPEMAIEKIRERELCVSPHRQPTYFATFSIHIPERFIFDEARGLANYISIQICSEIDCKGPECCYNGTC